MMPLHGARLISFGLLIVGAQLLSCSGPILPSRGMTVRLSESGPSQLEVERAVAAELRKEGFVEAGMDSRDVIKKQTTAFYFRGPNGLSVFVEVDLQNEVPIRVRQKSETFTSEANHTFEDLADALEARWPKSVTREPAPTK